MEYEYKKIKIEYIRDELTEEFHEGLVCFSFPFSGGNDIQNYQPYYLRSCAKPLQTSLMIDYGINVSDEELAFCSGSHAGENCHITVGKNLINKFGLREEMLKCGIHEPLSRTAQNEMLLNGENARAIHNNCSGKHIGFLAVCKKMGWDLESYFEPNHPLQIAVKNKINELCEIKEEYPQTTDGCGVPILSAPLHNIVKGYLNLLEKYPQIIKAIKENPYIFGGENRTDTEIIQKTDNIIAKVGAGGLCVVLNYKEKRAFVVKINDCSYEARKIALFEIINRLNWGNIDYDNKIKTLHGKVVGKIELKL